MTADEVLKDLETMTHKKILEKHKFEIYYSESEKSWRTYLPDETKPNKRRALKRTSRENLEKEIVKIKENRLIQKSSRKRNQVKQVAIVGYTNAPVENCIKFFGEFVKVFEELKENKEDVNDNFKVVVEDEDLCNLFLSKKVKNVVIKESPEFIKNRLIASGIRPINNVVDISNYVMLETGQPLHYYDADRLGDTLVVRAAKEGEKLTTLDEIERTLDVNDINYRGEFSFKVQYKKLSAQAANKISSSLPARTV